VSNSQFLRSYYDLDQKGSKSRIIFPSSDKKIQPAYFSCHQHLIPTGFPTAISMIFYPHAIPTGFPTAISMIFYRHAIPTGFPSVMTMIFYRHAIPMGFPSVMAMIFYRYGIPYGNLLNFQISDMRRKIPSG
jgi:hypothetical protein